MPPNPKPKKSAGNIKLPKPTPLRTVGRRRKGQGDREGEPGTTAGTHQPHWTADYSADEVEWMAAVQAWKARTGCAFPSLRDLLGVARGLGYRKVATTKEGDANA